MLDQPFMDEVHRFTYKGFSEHRHNKNHHRVLARFRQSLRQAQRMVIDDDAVRTICELSHDNKFDLWCILARLPFDTLWVEFDLHVKVKHWADLGTLAHRFEPDQVSRECGYLIQKDLDTSTRWVAHEFVAVKDKKPWFVTTQPVTLIFDPNGSPLQPVRGTTLWGKPTLSLEPGVPKIPIIGDLGEGRVVEGRGDVEYGYAGSFRIGDEDDPYPVMPAHWTEYKVGASLCPIWASALKRENHLKVAASDAKERGGALRWLVTALATINDVPNTVRSVHGRQGHMQVPGAPPLSYFSHNVVTLKIPKRNGIRYAAAAMTKEATGRHNKWHPVKGHWRHIEYGKKLPYFCRHIPSRVEGDVAWCERCERKLRWIELPHGRGSGALGYVDHTYVVTT